jgi:hypothetical protein
MMVRSGIRGSVVVLGALLAFANSASAFTFWSNQNGVGTGFSWSGGGSDNGLFGDPNLVGGNTFVFTPSAFRAESLNGVPDNKTDRIEVILLANPGLTFTGFRIHEGGDYGILQDGSVSATGVLTVEDQNVVRSASDNLVTSPASPILSGTGSWDGTAEVTLLAIEGWTEIKLVLENNLIAISAPGNISFIEKKFLGTSVEVLVPEPGSIALLGLGAAGLLFRRRVTVTA